MLQSRKVWQLFDGLEESEYADCEHWLTAMLHGTQPELLALFHALKQEHTDEDVWAHVFPNKPYNDNRFRFLSHHLAQHLETFLAWQTFQQSAYMKDLYLLKSFNRRRMLKRFQSQFNRTTSSWEKEATRNVRYYWARFQLEKEYQSYLLLDDPSKKKKPRRKELNEHFTSYWLLELLASSIDSLRLGKHFEEDLIVPLHQEVLALLSSHADYRTDNPLIHFLLELYQMVLSGEGELDQLISLLKQEKDKIGDSHILFSYTFLILNHLLHRFHNTRDGIFLETSYQLYLWGIHERIFIVDGYLSDAVFYNFISFGLELNHLEQSYGYIEQFQSLLAPKNKEETIQICKAKYYMKTQEYGKVIRISNMRFVKRSYERVARMMMIQARYENGDRDSLISALNGFKQYLKNHPLTNAASQKGYLHFVRLSMKLVKAYRKQDYQNILEQTDSPTLVQKEWIMEKCRTELK